MPRKLLILVAGIIALHVLEASTLRTSPSGSLLANLLEIFSCGFAVAMAFGACRRGRGLSRPLWLLVGLGIAMWGVANLGWMYYEVVLHAEPPLTSAVRFLFGFEAMFIAMALFLDQDKDSPTLDAESVLDFIQIAIVFFFIFMEFYFLPAHLLDDRSAFLREMRVENVEDVLLTGLAAFQALRGRKPHIRKLYGGLALYLASVTMCSALAQYLQSIRPAPTGTLRDLLWTLPFLGGALWAAQWKPSPSEGFSTQMRQKSLGELMLTNGTLVLAPLIILFQVSQLQAEWRLLRFSLLGVSILCYAARLGISQSREARSEDAVQTHALAMESAVDGIAIVNSKGKHPYVNSAFAKMLGFEDAAAMRGRGWREVYDPRDVQLLENKVRESLKQTGKWWGQVSLRRRDGTTIPLEMTITAMPQGGAVCVARDVSERERAEKARTDAEIKYRMLIEQVAAISYIAELGVHGEWLYVSPQVESILGFSQEEWLSTSRQWMRYVPVEDHVVIEAAEAACTRGERFQAEYRVMRKDGTIIWVSDTAVLVKGSDSHPVMEGIIVDITERKVLENQLQQSRRMEAVGRLAGGIAHDFNNLLTIIKGYAELALQRSGVQRELHSDIRQVENAADRASSLVRQLLAFSRRQVLQPKTIDLNAVVMSLDKLLRRLMDETIEMVTCCAADVGSVKADPAQIEQVIMNLVVNARDAMARGGRLTIETANVELDSVYARDHATVKPGAYVMLAVSDTGTGMSSDTMAHIFEPFYTTKESGQGTGLGLSTVYGIVKQSGGYIWVYSEVEKGTTFKVYLPRVDEPAEPKSEPTKAPAARKGTETILVVEDEEAVRELTCMILTAEGYSVASAKSGHEAESISSNHAGEIHLLLTDIVMPGTTGRELARRITEQHPRTRVLYMSGYTDNVLTQGGILQQGVSFLQKPFSPRTLTQKVREVLDSPVAAK